MDFPAHFLGWHMSTAPWRANLVQGCKIGNYCIQGCNIGDYCVGWRLFPIVFMTHGCHAFMDVQTSPGTHSRHRFFRTSSSLRDPVVYCINRRVLGIDVIDAISLGVSQCFVTCYVGRSVSCLVRRSWALSCAGVCGAKYFVIFRAFVT